MLVDKQLQYAPSFPFVSMQSCRGTLVGGRRGLKERERVLSKNEDVELLANIYSAEEWKERVKSLRSDERNGQQRSIQLTQSSLVGSRFRTDARGRD